MSSWIINSQNELVEVSEGGSVRFWGIQGVRAQIKALKNAKRPLGEKAQAALSHFENGRELWDGFKASQH